MELTSISLLLSGIVAMVQVFAFWDNRSIRAENKLSLVAKTSDVSEINTQLSLLQKENEKMALHLFHNDKETAVLSERVSNEIEMTSKFLEKIDQKIAQIAAK